MKKLPLIFSILTFALHSFSFNPIDPDRMEQFMDGVIKSKLEEKNIAGATLCIVNEDGTVVSTSYGYSDYENRIPVDADFTLFRIGSISKLFVWISVMQQVERGNLDLNKDINEYLVDFKIPDTYSEPITVNHLMTHTPGFEDKILKLFTQDSSEIKPLAEVLKHQIPLRIRPAGLHAAYSNHGSAMAAHIVELVSGMEWNDYVEQNIIIPLGMTSTTFRQPLPDSLASRISKGYKYVNGSMVEKSFEYIPLAPAGAATTCASDMSKFMQMLLNRGQFEGVSIIDTSTFRMMMEPVIYQANGVNPSLHGFMDVSHKGLKVVGHGGDTFWFHSLLALVPDQGVGLFLSFNSDGGGGTYIDVFDQFADQFLIDDFEPLPNIDLQPEELQKFAGEYKANRYPHSDYMKLISLMGRMEIFADQGKLKVVRDGKPSYWIPVGPMKFQKEHEADVMVFESDSEGNIIHAFDGRMSIMAYDKVKLIESQDLHMGIFIGVIVLSIIVIFYWPMVYFIRRKYQPMSIAKNTLAFGAKLTAWIAAFMLMIFYLLVSTSLGDVEASVYSTPSSLKFALVLPFLLILLWIIMLFKTWNIWKYGGTRIRSRFFYTFLLIANGLALWQIYYWNFLGWNY